MYEYPEVLKPTDVPCYGEMSPEQQEATDTLTIEQVFHSGMLIISGENARNRRYIGYSLSDAVLTHLEVEKHHA